MKRLVWQRGFGVVSFGKKQLPWVLRTFRTRRNITLVGAPRCDWKRCRWTMMERHSLAEAEREAC